MSSRFDGKVAIVTGGAQGIGGATARRLARDGAAVLIADIDETTANENRARIESSGGIVAVTRTDVGVAADVEAMVSEAIRRWGRLDYLVNNAFSVAGGGLDAGSISGGAVDVSEAAWDRGMAVLVKSIFLGVKYAVPAMRQAGGGSIVNVSSVHGLLMAEGFLVYEAGKSAVIGVTRQMACDYGKDAIRVNAICPGHIMTERQGAQWKAHPDGLRFFEEQYPIRRVGTPDDIAGTIAFLCSEDASFITGQALAVDGGLTIQLQENVGVRLAKHIQANPGTWLPY
ncbi:MAG: SDR family NAD(P)-dependent oxidoreductase [Chloroflexota bacterium]